MAFYAGGRVRMKETYDGKERRKHRRSNQKTQLLYHAIEGASLDHLSKMRNSTAIDVGTGGLCFETDVYVPADSIIEIRIKKKWNMKHQSGKF